MNIVRKCIDYINETIGISPEIKALSNAGREKLPYFINDSYKIYSCCLLNRDCILLQPREAVEYTPAELSKHAEVVRNYLSGDIILLFSDLTAYNRKRLIGYKTSFIVPKNQLYLPDLMIDLREHFKSHRGKKKEYLSPSAQAVLLYCILKKQYNLLPNDLLASLPYARMTLIRVMDELASFELAQTTFSGRNKLLRFDLTGQKLWEKALPLLRSPVKKLIYATGNILNNDKFYLAGISALSKYSMIAEDVPPVYAVEKDLYYKLKKNGRIEEMLSKDGALAQLEIWSYDPAILENKNRFVDPLSLYLSLRNYNDERIQGELEEMMGDRLW